MGQLENETESIDLESIELISERLIQLSTQLLDSKLSSSSSSSKPASNESVIALSANSLFVTLKALNRSHSKLVSRSKSKTSFVRDELDQIHLGLQNLVYERRYLEKEIQKCQEFESEYQNISIHSIEEYLRLNPQDLELTESASTESKHELMIKRLKYELSERKRFEAEKKELLQKKLKLSKENDEKKSKLDELEKQLDRFVTSAKEIQTKMATQV
ncbi:Fms-interacting protein-domain-containing protein [Phakopsora pachyrhizi]|uniref:Fms-interacting protein-domain-containing protein n=1 Tax=Phakopsora pachyrhizi TaxID=170000 RepID=A0AAV0AF22_PHAPC|nr:Fms-interacting protein-domain-containing protein [Phakopsora pachyrhizi]CAH7666707.1 Fms-interacting protein-domain-containing protein [Phakopsora pachyrhizi]